MAAAPHEHVSENTVSQEEAPTDFQHYQDILNKDRKSSMAAAPHEHVSENTVSQEEAPTDFQHYREALNRGKKSSMAAAPHSQVDENTGSAEDSENYPSSPEGSQPQSIASNEEGQQNTMSAMMRDYNQGIQVKSSDDKTGTRKKAPDGRAMKFYADKAAKATGERLEQAKAYVENIAESVISEVAEDVPRATREIQTRLKEVRQSCLNVQPCAFWTTEQAEVPSDNSAGIQAVLALSFLECLCTASVLSYFYTSFKSTYLAFIGTAVANILAMAVHMTQRYTPSSSRALSFGGLSVASMTMFCLYHAFKHPRHIGAIVPMNGLECLITAFATLGFCALFNYY